ncbi:MAG TPA: MarR family transcriptional regulator, partial [Anditalea sp.]|nr:MarR family transcriptional regulator [Anditalea sp.]
MPLTSKQKEIVETIGVFHEQNGLQPALGRIMGLIMVIDAAEVTFEEIVENLSLSKSAVSTALKLLQTQNKVEYTTKPGDRK